MFPPSEGEEIKLFSVLCIVLCCHATLKQSLQQSSTCHFTLAAEPILPTNDEVLFNPLNFAYFVLLSLYSHGDINNINIIALCSGQQ